MDKLRFKVVTKDGIESMETNIFEFVHEMLMNDSGFFNKAAPGTKEYDDLKEIFYDEMKFFTPEQYKDIAKTLLEIKKRMGDR